MGSTENGNIVSWKHEEAIHYVELSVDALGDLAVHALPWNASDKGSSFQLISMRNGRSNYKSAFVYYSNDILDNYIADVNLLSMDIASMITFSNILYARNDDYKYMMELNEAGIAVYDSKVDGFMSYEGESDVNILLVDTMNNDRQIGISECDAFDQSFAIVEFSAF